MKFLIALHIAGHMTLTAGPASYDIQEHQFKMMSNSSIDTSNPKFDDHIEKMTIEKYKFKCLHRK